MPRYTPPSETKARLYTTARVARNVLTHNAENDLREGDIVGVRFRCMAHNRLLRMDMPVFAIRHKGAEWGDLYAWALSDYVI